MLISFYNFLTCLFYIPYIFLIYLRKFLKKEHQVKFKEKIFLNKFKRPKGFLFWFHEASTSLFLLVDQGPNFATVDVFGLIFGWLSFALNSGHINGFDASIDLYIA